MAYLATLSIIAGWLDGAEGVHIELEPGFDIDGIRLKASLDFAAKATDYCSLYKNSGA
jgi:hypothetical protein